MKTSLLNIVNTVVIITILMIPVSSSAQSVMSSGSYKMQSDSINFAGVRSTSASYGLEDTAGEIATGDLTSSSYGAHIGFQAMFVLVSNDTTRPSQPPSISASALSASSIQVTWGQSTDNVAVTRYYIYRDGVRIDDVATFPRVFVDTDLSSNTTYSYNVSAVDDADNESLWSATTTAETLSTGSGGGSTNILPTPIGLQIIPSDTIALITFKTTTPVKATLSWGSDASYSMGASAENIALTDHRVLVTNLESNSSYLLKIVLTRQDGFSAVFDNIPFNTLTVTPPVNTPNVSNFSAIPNTNDVSLTWNLPDDSSVNSVRIMRSDTFYPDSPSSGEVIFTGLGAGFRDENVEIGKKYYYTIFTRDLYGNYSSGVIAHATIAKPGEIPPVIEPPLDEVPIIDNVDPIIKSLELKDFLFIQNGDSLSVKNGSVTVDGSKNLAVALKYYRVPPVLKTIAVTLVTQEVTPRSFTFILRANKDKTRYESVIAPLGDTDTYNLKITVVDFKNQGLARITGRMHVLGQYNWNMWALLISSGVLLGLVVIGIVWRERKKKRGQLAIA